MTKKGIRPSRHTRIVWCGRRRRQKRKVLVNPHISRIIFRSKRNKDIKVFKKIADKARAKGYNIPPINSKRGPISVANDPIPESFFIDAFTMPVEDALSAWDSKFARQKGRGKYYIGVDDDAQHENRVKGFSHELGHVVQIQQNIKPHTEAKADKIGADILDIPLKEFRKDIVFDQDFFKAGIQLPKNIPKKLLEQAKLEGKNFGSSPINYDEELVLNGKQILMPKKEYRGEDLGEAVVAMIEKDYDKVKKWNEKVIKEGL